MKKKVSTKTRKGSTSTSISKDFTRREASLAKGRQKSKNLDRKLTYRERVKAEKASVKKSAIRSTAAGTTAVSATQQPGDTYVSYDDSRLKDDKRKGAGSRDSETENNQQNGGIGGINGPGDSDFV